MRVQLIFSLIFFLDLLFSIPALRKSKKENGKYFSDPKVFTTASKIKRRGLYRTYGLNSKNIFGFLANLILVALFIALAFL